MSGVLRTVALAALFLCALTLYASLEQSGRMTAADPSALLDAIRHPLAESGLHQRDDVLIEINGREVALGFSRPGCEGLLLVSVLPRTAQGWAHMAPRLDFSTYRLAYFYDGVLYPSAPRFARLADELQSDIRPHRNRSFAQVVAIAEGGHCGLVRTAAVLLKGVSKGWLPTDIHSESGLSQGEDSA